MKKKIRRNKQDKDGYEYNFDGVDIRNFKPAKLPDWFPSPAELARRMRHAKITIHLDDGTVVFFKREAKKYKTSYQKMIREVLRKYKDRMDRAA